jgi:hypothetical protein
MNDQKAAAVAFLAAIAALRAAKCAGADEGGDVHADRRKQGDQVIGLVGGGE